MFESPVGDLTLVSDGEALVGLYFPDHRHGPVREGRWIEDASVPVLMDAAAQLGEFFDGERTSFDIPLRSVGTDFQMKVWAQLSLIPFGETITYGELARRVGNPAASRAVGLANGRNPISIIVPCHRVIGANGSLTGFGGGVGVKRQLLERESGSLSLPGEGQGESRRSMKSQI